MDRETYQDAVERLANSQTLARHPGLRHLFLYLAGKSLSDDVEDLKEYVIGVEALGKPSTYDPQRDASVRVQASRLRKCLTEYYELECPEDRVEIRIPKGQFRLTFQLRGEQASAPAMPAASPPCPPVALAADSILERRLRAMTRACVMLLLVAAMSTAALLFSWTTLPTRAAQPILTPELLAIWGSYIRDDRPVLMVLGTPLFAKYTTSETGVFFRDPRVNDWQQTATAPGISKVGAAVGSLQVTPSRIYTGVGEALGAFQLSTLLVRAKPELLLRRSHALSWDDFRDRNIIVLGAPKHNLHLNHLPVQQQFALFRDSVHNLHPLHGEPEFFRPTFASGYEELEEDHALISRFPGLHGIGETTVLAGSSTEATLAAVEFVTRPHYAAELTKRLADSVGRMPSAYQVVLRARFKSQTPVEIHYVTHRVLKPAEHAAAY